VFSLAQQLLKISEKTREASEVTFTEKLNATAKAITTVTSAPGARDSRPLPSSSKFSLEALKHAAAAGILNFCFDIFFYFLCSFKRFEVFACL
jgi:hypothetical protein